MSQEVSLRSRSTGSLLKKPGLSDCQHGMYKVPVPNAIFARAGDDSTGLLDRLL